MQWPEQCARQASTWTREVRGELTAEQALQPPWQRALQMLAWENREVVAAQVTQVASESHLSHPSGKTVTKGSG